MSDAVYIQQYKKNNPISVEYRTTQGQFRASHWHPELEILYILNGSADVIIEGESHKVVQGDLIVIDANQIHEAKCTNCMMQLIVHVDRAFIDERLGTSKPYLIHCSRMELIDEQLGAYLELCDRCQDLVRLFVGHPEGYRLESDSIIMDILYRLVRDFAIPLKPDDIPELSQQEQRLRDILQYINEHYAEPITLEEISSHFGLSREYFSRLFKKKIGMTFTEHLSRVRLARIYHDLMTGNEPIMALTERHGFTNYKLFLRDFKEIYGMTAREARARRTSS